MAYADASHSKTDPPTFVTPHTYALRIARFGADKADRVRGLRTRFAIPTHRPELRVRPPDHLRPTPTRAAVAAGRLALRG